MSEHKVANQVTCFSVRWSIPVILPWQNARALFLTWLKFICAVKAVFQIESHQSGQLHIQAFVQTKDKKRPLTLAKGSNLHLSGVEISAASANGRLQLEAYCMKPETRVHGPWGYPVALYTGKDLYTIPWPWQLQLENLLQEEPDDRTIWWISDLIGATGKSKFVKKMSWLHDSCFLAYARTENLLYVVTQKISTAYLVDLTRAKPRDIAGDDLYSALEQIKNGMVLSTKFIPKTVYFDPPHVIVFANQPPKVDRMSQDRWKVIRMDQKNLELIHPNLRLVTTADPTTTASAIGPLSEAVSLTLNDPMFPG